MDLTESERPQSRLDPQALHPNRPKAVLHINIGFRGKSHSPLARRVRVRRSGVGGPRSLRHKPKLWPHCAELVISRLKGQGQLVLFALWRAEKQRHQHLRGTPSPATLLRMGLAA